MLPAGLKGKRKDRLLGEITVKADLVTQNYFNDADDDLLAKIPDTDGKV